MFRPKILCFVSHYLPGYKSGGPVKSIHNLTEHLTKTFEFLIVTSDRDLNDTQPYKSISINKWNKVGKVKVFYASKSFLNINNVSNLINETKHDILYLNSFFNFKFTTIPLITKKFFLNTKTPCILAPRGEFSPEAMKINFWKKKVYILIVSLLGLYKKINWQASCDNEYKDILANRLIKKKFIKIAPDLPKKYSFTKKFKLKKNKKRNGLLKIVFLSRINPMKNLDFLIKVLIKIKKKIYLNIFGPIENEEYWVTCKKLIENLPKNITVNYKGVVTPNRINLILSSYDLFILPSRGESYGHVILEALTSSTPVMISNKTPWKTVKNAITVLSLKNKKKWTSEIEKWVDFGDDKVLKRRISALNFAKRNLLMKKNIKKNEKFFLHFINKNLTNRIS